MNLGVFAERVRSNVYHPGTLDVKRVKVRFAVYRNGVRVATRDSKGDATEFGQTLGLGPVQYEKET